MKSLLKIMLVLALIFASTFIIAKVTGVLSVEKVEAFLTTAQSISPLYLAFAVIGLLFADLFIAVPTLTITILAGYFLGWTLGTAAALTGLYCAGLAGYFLSSKYGDNLVNLLIKDNEERERASHAFRSHGFVTILMSRAVPILPEVSACMAGLTNMKLSKFILAWSIGTIPYVMIAAYAGSISSIDDPKPAIITALSLTGALWLCWFMFNRKVLSNPPQQDSSFASSSD